MTDRDDDPAATGNGGDDCTTASRRGVLRSIGALCTFGASGTLASAAPSGGSVDGYVPDDDLFDQQYVPKMVRAPKAWETTTGSDDVTIGILGTGVDYDHPDLKDRFGETKGADFIDEDDGDPHPNPPRCFVRNCTLEVHGTMVAGIASATMDNDEGIAGISQSRLLNARAIPGGNLPVESAHVDCGQIDAQIIRRRLAEGARYLVDKGADVLNMSLSFETLEHYRRNASEEDRCDDPEWDPVWDEAVEYAVENDVLVVSGSGNQGKKETTINYPARKEFSGPDAAAKRKSLVAVSGVGKPGFLRKAIRENRAATNDDGEIAWDGPLDGWRTPASEWDVQLWGTEEKGSHYGDQVDICAPVNPIGPITDRWYMNDYRRPAPGLSWAVPVVSGVAALALAANPDLSAPELGTILRESARRLDVPGIDAPLERDVDVKQGHGLVDAANAVEMATEW